MNIFDLSGFVNIYNDIKTIRFWRHLVVSSFAVGGAISALLQFFIMISPPLAIQIQGLGPLITILIVSFVIGVILSWPRPIEMSYSLPSTSIKIIKGNLLNEVGSIVIGVCDTFDTQIPNIISNNSILGQAIIKLYSGNYNVLDGQISVALKNANPIGRISKQGKQDVYEIGTVAYVQNNPLNIYLLAYSKMNEKNQSYGTVDSVWVSLNKLWEAHSLHGNQGSISVPVIGGGQARMSGVLPAQDSIKLIILSYMFASRKNKVADELRIVVSPKEYKLLDRMELQSFLSSLRAS